MVPIFASVRLKAYFDSSMMFALFSSSIGYSLDTYLMNFIFLWYSLLSSSIRSFIFFVDCCKLTFTILFIGEKLLCFCFSSSLGDKRDISSLLGLLFKLKGYSMASLWLRDTLDSICRSFMPFFAVYLFGVNLLFFV